jgi:hypothetical protein
MAGCVMGTPRAVAQDFVIRGATVHTASAKGTLKNTDVVVRGGMIVAIGSDAGSGAVIDARGKELTPGLFGGLTDIGLEEIAAEAQTVDSTLNLKSPEWDQQWRPELDVTLAYNPRSFVVPITRIEGVTWTVLVPALQTASSEVRARRLCSTADTMRHWPAAARCSCKWERPAPGRPAERAPRNICFWSRRFARRARRGRSVRELCCMPRAVKR